MELRLKIILTSLLFVMTTGLVHAQLSDTIPMDPKLRYGKLSNGFTYYIHNNGQPEIALGLLVKAGDVNESKDQLGLAHLLEHVLMQGGTTHTPAGGLGAFVMKEGLVGYNYGANTATSSTSYHWTIPVTRPELLSKSMRMLRDYAYDDVVLKNLMDPVIVDNERKSVLGEFMGHDMNAKVKLYRLLGEPKGHRSFDPAVEEAHNAYIKVFPLEPLSRFYKDWYRPDHEAVFVVGNVDVDKIEKQIKELFSDLKNPENPPVKSREEYLKQYAVALSGRNNVFIQTDKKITSLEMDIYMKHPALGFSNGLFTKTQYRTKLLQRLYSEMMRLRMLSLKQKYLPNFQEAISYVQTVAADAQMDAIVTRVKGSTTASLRKTVEDVFVEMERVKRDGFTGPELAKAKQWLLKDTQDNVPNSMTMSGAYRGHLEFGIAIPGPAYEATMIKEFIPEISLKEVNQLSAKLINVEQNMDIVISAPEKDKGSLPTENELMKWIAQVDPARITPYKDPTVAVPVMSADQIKKLSGSPINKTTIDKEIAVTKWKLSNGIQLILKPIDTKGEGSDEIFLRGVSPGGYSQYPKEDHYAATAAAEIIMNSGVGGLNKFELATALSDKKVNVYPYIGYDEETIEGSSSLKDLETMLQLVHQYFVSPNKSEAAFKDWMTNTKADIERRMNFPQAKFFTAIETTTKTNQNKPTLESLEKLKLEKAIQIYKDRFANAGDFTFVITGNYDIEKIKPLLLRYLGSLPVSPRKEKILEPELAKPIVGLNKTILDGNENTDLPVMLNFSGPYDPTVENNILLDVLGIIVRNVSFKRLVEKEGVYYNGASARYQRKPLPHYLVKFDFSTDDKTVERRIAAVLQEMAKLAETGPEEDIFKGAIIEKKRKLENDLKSPHYWLGYLAEQYQTGGNAAAILKAQSFLEKMTIKDIREAAAKYMNTKNFNRFVMLPQAQKAF